MSAFDGYLYAWKPSGKKVPGWPVRVQLPAADLAGTAPNDYVHDTKLISPPASATSSAPASRRSSSPAWSASTRARPTDSWIYGIWPDGNRHAGGPYMPGWPVGLTSLAGCYDQSIDFVEEGATPPSIADFDGSGQLRVVTIGRHRDAGGAQRRRLGVQALSAQPARREACNAIPPYYPGDPLTISLTGQGAIGDLLGNGTPDYVQSSAGGISLTNALGGSAAALPQTYEKAWDVPTGDVLPELPPAAGRLPVLRRGAGRQPERRQRERGASTPTTPAGSTPTSRAAGEAPGFPKFTGQWPSFSGVVGDPKFNGNLRLAYGTREGSLFLWRVGGKPSRNDSWWHYHHDEHNSGLYGNDTRRPAVAANLRLIPRRGHATLRWRAPGDDGVSGGPVKRYEIFVSHRRITQGRLDRIRRVKPPTPGAPSHSQEARISRGRPPSAVRRRPLGRRRREHLGAEAGQAAPSEPGWSANRRPGNGIGFRRNAPQGASPGVGGECPVSERREHGHGCS